MGVSDNVHPELPDGGRFMSDHALAKHFMEKGWYRNAEQKDDCGWTALHHAVQATVFWDQAMRVCRGLIAQMSPEALEARTWAERPCHYTALHMAANGADINQERAELVHLLVKAMADVDSRDPWDRTPFLLAAGTGVVDTARALSQAGADVFWERHDGRNAADIARGSSAAMSRWSLKDTILPGATRGHSLWCMGLGSL